MTAVPAIGLSATAAFLRGGSASVREFAQQADEAGLDYLQVGDHVSFLDGTGFDGMVLAAAALCAQDRMPVQIGLYLLALRHPVPVARQLADLATLAPGRIRLGVGVGGEDRHEFEICGVDPATRGRRTDSAMQLVRALLTGRPVDHLDEFFEVSDAVVSPAPAALVPFVVGGRSDAALRRVGRYGDGWLALWASHRRYRDALATIDDIAAEAGRADVAWDHGLNLWCGPDGIRRDGRETLAAAMQQRYKMPFERFEKWCPTGDPERIAEFINGYVDAGARHVTLVLHHDDLAESIDAAARIREHVVTAAAA